VVFAGPTPADLAAYNIPRSDFPDIIRESMPSGSLRSNPKRITEEDVEWLLEQVAGAQR
jgi:alcohol dehydrogenase class IV